MVKNWVNFQNIEWKCRFSMLRLQHALKQQQHAKTLKTQLQTFPIRFWVGRMGACKIGMFVQSDTFFGTHSSSRSLFQMSLCMNSDNKHLHKSQWGIERHTQHFMFYNSFCFSKMFIFKFFTAQSFVDVSVTMSQKLCFIWENWAKHNGRFDLSSQRKRKQTPTSTLQWEKIVSKSTNRRENKLRSRTRKK